MTYKRSSLEKNVEIRPRSNKEYKYPFNAESRSHIIDTENRELWKQAGNAAASKLEHKVRNEVRHAAISAFDALQTLDAQDVRRAFESVKSKRQSRSRRATKTGPKFLPSFVAIDFETANSARSSACSVALVRVDVVNGRARITRRSETLIKPVPQLFDPRFVRIHGIKKSDVKNAPLFWQVQPRIAKFIEGAAFFVAHNAGFDRSVLQACSEHTGTLAPTLPFLCTVKLSRRVFGHGNAGLAQVSKALGIELDHHNASSDAQACAQVLMVLAKTHPTLVHDAITECTHVKVNANARY